MNIDDLKFDSLNANAGTQKGSELLRESIERYLIGKGILADRNNVVMCGNKTLAEVKALGYTEIEIVDTEGDELIAIQREDLDIEEESGRGMSIADNRVGQKSLNWNASVLKELQEDIDLMEGGLWTRQELEKMFGEPPKRSPGGGGDGAEPDFEPPENTEDVFVYLEPDLMKRLIFVLEVLREHFGVATHEETIMETLRYLDQMDEEEMS